MALKDFFSRKHDQEENDLLSEPGQICNLARKEYSSSVDDPSVLPDWARKQLDDANKKVRIAEKALDECKKKSQELQSKLNSAKEDTERKIEKVKQELSIQIEFQKERAVKAEKDNCEIADKLKGEFIRNLHLAQQKAQQGCENIDRLYRRNLNLKMNENVNLRRQIDELKAQIEMLSSGKAVENDVFAQKLAEERLLMEQWAESERQKALAEAEELISEALSEKQDNVFKSYPEASPFASLALKYISTIDSILSELDLEIKEHYTDSDDANYFYVRRRLKYLESIGDQNLVRYWDNDLELLATHGIVLVGSELDKAIGEDETKIVEILRYYLYNAVIHKTAGPALILVREMIAMPIYAGVKSVVNLQQIKDLEQQLIATITELGYEIVDVDLFKPLGSSPDIICVEQNEIELDGVESGQVYEIVKIAVNFDSFKDKTEVKVKS